MPQEGNRRKSTGRDSFNKTSSAYDFELFMPRKKIDDRNKIVRLPAARPAVRKHARRHVSTFGVFATALLISLCTLLILVRIENGVVANQIISEQATLKQLQVNEGLLQNQLDAKQSLSNVASAAEALGMTKADPNQIHYITPDGANAAATASDTSSSSSGTASSSSGATSSSSGTGSSSSGAGNTAVTP